MVKIISDSTCDLSEELLKRYDIDVLPLHVMLGEEDLLDDPSILDRIYEWSDENKTTPKTAAPSEEEAQRCFLPYLKEGREIVCFSISSSMSASYSVMNMAAGALMAENRIHIVDSANLSTGLGLLVTEAAVMAQEGRSAQEIVARAEELKPQVRASFVVDTLQYLYRGGRCSGLTAIMGGALRIHPKIVVKEGDMSADKRYRGNLKKAVMDYAHDLEPLMKKAKPDRAFITHGGCDRDIIEELRSYVESLGIFSEVIETRAGGVVSSHCGYGTIGVLFIEEEERQ